MTNTDQKECEEKRSGCREIRINTEKKPPPTTERAKGSKDFLRTVTGGGPGIDT